MKDIAVKRWSAFHAALYRSSRGLVGNRLVGNDMLLLTTKGRVTGTDHTVPLLYLRQGGLIVVVASYGGRPHHPGWYHNLVADPSVRVQVRGKRLAMSARTATAEERTRWWPLIVRAYEGYTLYQSRTARQIPVVFLEPLDMS